MADNMNQSSIKGSPSVVQPGDFEREIIEKLAFGALTEQRRTRRWGIFFKFLLAIYLVVIVVISRPDMFADAISATAKHTAVVDVNGIISEDSDASADNVVAGLRAAFKDSNTVGVIIRVNSPGGNPVEAGYINDEIYRLKKEYPAMPVYAVVQDIGASGGYYVAVAADKIYADKASIVGSIGVRMENFGFVEAIEKLGIERRLLTAGEKKGLMDPFLPIQSEIEDHLQGVLDEIHRQFIEIVKKGRGDRLSAEADLFTGLVWTGEQCLELGLVDALGSTGFVAREIVGEEKIVDFTPRKDILSHFAKTFGVALSESLIQAGLQVRL